MSKTKASPSKKKLIEIGKPITKLTAVNRPTRAKNYSDENLYGYQICITFV